MLGRNSGRLVISISSFGSSLPLSCSSLPFFGEDSKGLSQEVMLTLAVLVNVVAIEHSILVLKLFYACVRPLPFTAAGILFAALTHSGAQMASCCRWLPGLEGTSMWRADN